MFEFPASVGGWLTEEEGFALAAVAAGRDVLEIGSFKGKSTLCLAHAARSVTAVDPFDGRATPEPGSTWSEYLANTIHLSSLTTHRGTIDEVGPRLPVEFDLVFIDGDHRYECVRNDTEWALRLLRPGGLIAFHDYRTSNNPGVNRAVDDLLLDGGRLIHRAGSVAVVLPPDDLVTGHSGPRVVLAMPHRGSIHAAAARAFFEYPTRRLRDLKRLETSPETLDLLRLDMSSSVLTLNFNRMWAEALNAKEMGFTHFAMLHDDVCPDPGWLDVLLDEITRHEADVISAVVPIKSAHALTSTALGYGDGSASVFRPLRRLTMTEVFDLPETFSRDDVTLDGPPTLFVNTGCWIADLRKPWAQRNVFRNVDRLVKVNGRWKADCLSEDWAFSVDLARWGAKVMATRKVSLYHDRPEFHNRERWGGWLTDEEYVQRTTAEAKEPALA